MPNLCFSRRGLYIAIIYHQGCLSIDDESHQERPRCCSEMIVSEGIFEGKQGCWGNNEKSSVCVHMKT